MRIERLLEKEVLQLESDGQSEKTVASVRRRSRLLETCRETGCESAEVGSARSTCVRRDRALFPALYAAGFGSKAFDPTTRS
jgi:hypothetical protein